RPGGGPERADAPGGSSLTPEARILENRHFPITQLPRERPPRKQHEPVRATGTPAWTPGADGTVSIRAGRPDPEGKR
ncbi:MAG: hypothetical protein ACREAA_15245, partial [Candidatus Polarisedimenticolia bacterium]